MPREEAERENLLRDAIALRDRGEYRVPGFAEPVTIGFHPRGGCAIFVGQDPVYHFNSQWELRRAYMRMKLYKAEQRRLVELNRVRTADQTELRRHELSAAEQTDFLAAAQETITRLKAGFADPALVIVGEVLAAGAGAAGSQASNSSAESRPLVKKIQAWLTILSERIAVAHTVNVL